MWPYQDEEERHYEPQPEWQLILQYLRQEMREAETPEECPCGGSGWAVSQLDTWEQCPQHYTGQTHPEYAEYEEE